MIARIALALLLFTLAAAVPVAVAQPTPAVELGSILDNVHVYADKGHMVFMGPGGRTLQVAFLPEPPHWDPEEPERSGGHRFWALLQKGKTEVARFAFLKEPIEGRFSKARTRGMGGKMQAAGFKNEFTFAEEGNYQLTFVMDKTPLTRIPIQVRFAQIGDEFDGTRVTLVDGYWSRLGLLDVRLGAPNPRVEFHTWLRQIPTGAAQPQDRYTVQIHHGGDVVAEATTPIVVAHHEWRRARFPIRYPKGQGKGVYGAKNLLQKDGDYHVVLKKNGKLHGVYTFKCQGGKLVPFARSSGKYQPRLDYIVPRVWSQMANKRSATTWAVRLTGDKAAAIASARPAAPTGPSDADRARWVVKSRVPTDRAFAITVTSARPRPDTTLVAGDGIIAYGTGGFTGVEMLRVGASQPESIPKGQDFHANMLGVCGKKLLLFTKNCGCAVYDTEAKKLTEFPETVIRAPRLVGGPYKANLFATSGHLAVVVNDQARVQDRATIKVLDLSGAEPVVIPLRNPADLQARQVTSVAVDAATGKVAVSSRANKAIYVADVAPGGVFRKFDLSGHDGVGDAAIAVAAGHVLYRDGSGAAKARLIELGAGRVRTPGLNPVPRRPTRAVMGCGKYAYAVDQGRGSNFAVVVGKLGADPTRPANCGAKMAAAAGEFGLGASVALAGPGTVFLAGAEAIGSGEFLQALGADGKWRLLKGPDGKPIPASDVVAGPGIIAFKTGKNRNVAIGYAVFGAKIDLTPVTAE